MDNPAIKLSSTESFASAFKYSLLTNIIYFYAEICSISCII